MQLRVQLQNFAMDKLTNYKHTNGKVDWLKL